jgi:GT2 family glycosyltransferase
LHVGQTSSEVIPGEFGNIPHLELLMEISAIVVSWNAREYLRQCLDSIVNEPLARSIEVIVVDNASTDGSADMVESEFPSVCLIRNDANVGFAAANNQAIQQCSGRYITLINSDVKVLPGCVDTLAQYLDDNACTGNVGPLALNGDMTVQCTCREFPGLWNNFCSAAGLSALFRRVSWFSGEQMFYFAHDRTCRVDALGGCFWMVRSECFADVGLLDESFFMYGEDIDWCRRCRDRGWDVVFLPAARAIHYGGRSSANAVTRMALAQQESLLRYWAKHQGRAAQLGIRFILFLRYVLRLLAERVTRTRRSGKIRQDEQQTTTRKACLRALMGSSWAEAPERRLG